MSISYTLFLPDAVLSPDLQIRSGDAVLCSRVDPEGHGADSAIVAVGASDQLLASVGPSAPVTQIRLPGRMLLPGTINAHNHSFQSLLRGIADDRPFLVWRDEALYRYAPALGVEGVYGGALLAFAEMARMGITTVCDFFYVHGQGIDTDMAVRRAARDVGVRLVIARTMYDWDGAPACFRESVPEAVRHFEELHAALSDDATATVLPAPHSPHGASPEMIQAGAGLASDHELPWHLHLAEEPFEVEEIQSKFGTTPVGYLEQISCLDERLCIVHGVHLPRSDIEALGAKKAGLLHCPSSNMFLGDGAAPLVEMMGCGMRPALGTDGGCSNNRVSIFEEMRMASLLQKVTAQDGAAFQAEQAFRLGTEGGASLCSVPCGRIEAGHAADFVAIDLGDLSLQPPAAMLRNIVYAMQPTAIQDVFVAGKPVVRDGRLCRISEAEVAAVARETGERIGLTAV